MMAFEINRVLLAFLTVAGFAIYIVIGAFLACLVSDGLSDLKENVGLFAVLWPLFLVGLLVYLVFYMLPYAVAKRVYFAIRKRRAMKIER